MSNALAVAAITTTLQAILSQSITADTHGDLHDTTITFLPLDKARGTNTSNQLNLFLYQIMRSAAWSNSDMPRQVRPGETAFPPLALNLYYLVTAFGRDNDVSRPFGHQLLGKAMLTLHDHMLISPEDIRAATVATLPNSDLDRQVEHLRITFQPLSLDELSKLWTGFAMQLRLSAAYEVSVALIDSQSSTKSPLPVLTRGQGDSGVRSVASLTPPFPALESIDVPRQQASALLNDAVILRGHDLDGTNVGVLFKHPLWTAPIETPIASGPDATATAVRVTIPNDPVNWPAGIYTVQVLVQRTGDSFRRTTNQLAFSLAPTITITPATAPAGNITYSVTCSPEVRPQQRAALLFGSQEILAAEHAAQTSALTFAAVGAVPGDYFVRLRVDGVDSLLLDKTATPPVFDPTQKVTVT
jgi:hypothetical protein